jgi:hypothetical protein
LKKRSIEQKMEGSSVRVCVNLKDEKNKKSDRAVFNQKVYNEILLTVALNTINQTNKHI